MAWIDWIVLGVTLATIVGYGTWKTRKNTGLSGYLKGDNEMKWATIGLSIMATQASAITFLSTPGKAYESGMGFLQFYIGLPIAMILLSVFVLPRYYKLKVYTAYEYLESRFDLKTRMFTAFLFLVQRGLAAGITIYAPAIVLSTVLGWNLDYMNILVGVLVIIYTVSGGTRAVSLTQKWQMAVIMIGMFIAFGLIVSGLPEELSFGQAVNIAGEMGKMELINFNIDLESRYTIWSGLFGGVFLFLSYFGTDQSQVQRYLSGKSLRESRMGLMMNGMLKIPMQFFILFVGVMVFVFYQFEKPPVFFNNAARDAAMQTEYKEELLGLEQQYDVVWEQKNTLQLQYAESGQTDFEAIRALEHQGDSLRNIYKETIQLAGPQFETKDYDYIFISWVLDYLPAGLVGLLIAVILSAAMSSTAGELNALASTTVVDFYKRSIYPDGSDTHYVRAGRMFTVFWGVLALLFALYASLFENLIEAVNLLGSLFYGSILGVFAVAFFVKYVKANAVFISALFSQLLVLLIYLFQGDEIGFLWYNFFGCTLVVTTSIIVQAVLPNNPERTNE